MWCDQAKSVWSRSNSVFIFLLYCMHHFYSYILQKSPLKLVNWSQRYDQLKDDKNNRKQKVFSTLSGSILKSIFPTSDWFCLITSHMVQAWYIWKLLIHKLNIFRTVASFKLNGFSPQLIYALRLGIFGNFAPGYSRLISGGILGSRKIAFTEKILHTLHDFQLTAYQCEPGSS